MKLTRQSLHTEPIRDRKPYDRPALSPVPRQRWHVLTGVMVLADIASIVFALVVTTLVRFGGTALERSGPYGRYLVLWVPMWVLGLALSELYDRHRIENAAEELRQIVRGVTLGASFAIVASWSLHFPLSRIWAGLAYVLGLAFVSVQRRIVRKVIHALRRRGRLRRRTVIVGTDQAARDLAAAMAKAPHEGLDLVGYVATREFADEVRPLIRVVGTVKDLREITVREQVEEVLVSRSVAVDGLMGEVVAALDGVRVELRLSAGIEGFMPSRLTVHPLGDKALLSVERTGLQASARLTKRVMDVLFGGIAGVIALPFVAIAALGIRATSRGPAFFRQIRVGSGGKPFTVYKLRTMVESAERQRGLLDERNESDGILFKMREDPRVTPLGRFLRKTSLDELPQLWNVIRGEMSLVGPRPPLPEEVARYDDKLGRRLLVKPGITGLWQVSGRNELSFDDYMRFDLLYVQNWSVVLDLYILARTVPAVLFRRGAY